MANTHCTHAKCAPFSALPAAFTQLEERISETQEGRGKPLPEAKVSKGSVANCSPASLLLDCTAVSNPHRCLLHKPPGSLRCCCPEASPQRPLG